MVLQELHESKAHDFQLDIQHFNLAKEHFIFSFFLRKASHKSIFLLCKLSRSADRTIDRRLAGGMHGGENGGAASRRRGGRSRRRKIG
jgi:hypothetical protein